MSDRYDDSVDDSIDDESVAEYDTDEGELEKNPGEHGKWISLVLAALGAWLIVSPWLLDIEFGDVMGTNTVIVGAALAILGGYNFYRRADERLASVAVAMLAALLGLWLLVSPWVFDLGLDDMAGWNLVVVGILAGILGLYSGYEARDQKIDAVAVD